MPATADQGPPELSAGESDYSVPESTTDLVPAPLAEEEPKPRTRRAPARPRARRATGAEGPLEQASGEVEPEISAEVPAGRRPRSRGVRSRTAGPAAASVEQSVESDASPEMIAAPPAELMGQAEEEAVAEAGSLGWSSSEIAGNVSEPARYRASSLPEGRGLPAQSADFEPMPPPTKRKAPRVGFGIARPPQAAQENAVDWALGRTSTVADDAVVEPGDATLPSSRRRRSRRGRRGHGSIAEAAVADADLQPGVAAPAVEDRVIAAPLRERVSSAPSQPPRDDRTRSQLSTFETLVARQNVVLDALLAKVSSFANIERALNVIERRLSGATSGAAGVATPRVGIFVDVPNIIYAAERIGATIDFGRLLHLLSRGRELVRASAYAPISDDPQQRLDTQRFVQPFMHRGYRIMTKPLKRFSDGTMKGNFDVELAMDVLTMSDRLDIVSLVSGDGDFSRLVEIVGSKGVRVEVVAFGTSTSAELRAMCDDYLDISEHLHELT